MTTETTPQALPRRTESGMQTRAVNAAAGVLLAAMQQGRQTPTGLALALDAAQLLNSPEHAARVAELEARLAEYERPADEDPIRYALTDKAAPVVGGCPRNVIDGDIGAHLFKHGAFVEVPMRCMYCGAAKPEDDVTPQVEKLRGLLAGQRAAVEDPHDSPLHHDYRVGRDLPEVQL